MKRTLIAIATAASFGMFAGPLAAERTTTTGDSAVTSGQDGSPSSIDAPDRTSGGQRIPGQSHQGTATSGITGAAGGQTSGSMAGGDRDFFELDRNQDGELDQEELSRYGSTAAGSTDSNPDKDTLDRMDKDGSGSVSEEEFSQHQNVSN